MIVISCNFAFDALLHVAFKGMYIENNKETTETLSLQYSFTIFVELNFFKIQIFFKKITLKEIFYIECGDMLFICVGITFMEAKAAYVALLMFSLVLLSRPTHISSK